MMIVSAQQLELFMSLFRGREDAYARRWEKNGRSGYSPAYDFNWNEFLAHKNRGGSMKDFGNKKLLPLTATVMRQHLLGQQVIGVYPILADNTSYFIAADFDGESWKNDARALLHAYAEVGLSAYLERSRSGNGGHVWLFFSKSYPCYKSRHIVLELIRRAFHISEFEKEVSFDRLFPNQDSLSREGFGNLIALPLQGGSFSQGNTVFIDSDTDRPFPDQWTFLQKLKRHTVYELDSVHTRLFTDSKQVEVSPTHGLSLVVSNQITLLRAQFSPSIIHFLKEELNFLNTEYLAKKRLGKSTYKVQKYFKLIDERGDTISLPRGFLNQLVAFLDKNGIYHTLREDHAVLKETIFGNNIKLTPAQEATVKRATEYNQGIIVAPSGSGKTIMGLELIARRKQPALILVHRKQILDQWVERIQAFLGIAKIHIGQYSGVKKKVGKQITVGLLQSLARRGDLSELKNSFGTILIDECHHIPASTFREVTAQLNPKYLYGLTATPKRKHNDEKLIYVFIGDIIAQMAVSDVPIHETKVNSTYTLEVLVRSTSLEVPFKFTTDLFHLLAKIISCDTGRNRLIVGDILNEVGNNKKILVLSERKEHLEILNMYLKSKCETIVISGDDSARLRKSKLAQIESGHYQVILSTGQFFGEGIDIHGTTCLVLAFPFSFEGKLIQYMGRLRDIGAQKLIIDYRDKQIPFLERQFKQRMRHYKKLKANIMSL